MIKKMSTPYGKQPRVATSLCNVQAVWRINTSREIIMKHFTDKSIWQLVLNVLHEWSNDNAQRLGAALAFYAGFSIAPLLIIALAFAGLVFGPDVARGAIHGQLADLIGNQGAEGVEGMIASAGKPSEGIAASLIGIALLILGASGVFGELQSSLNTIWHVRPKADRRILRTIKDRFLSFSMVLGTGFLLLVSLVISAVLAALENWLGQQMPTPIWITQAINACVSLGVVTILFALIFKVVPDVEIKWKDVWIGGAVTAVLFTIGKFLLGRYLGTYVTTSAYGAAGSFVIVLLWVYYSSQIIFLGAEFTKVYAQMYGSGVQAANDAEAIS